MIESIPSTHLKKHILKNKIKTPSSQIDLKKFNRVFLIAIGKSAGTMTEYVSKKINFESGIVLYQKGLYQK